LAEAYGFYSIVLQDLMHKVWDVAVLMANTVIFALIGVMVAEIAWQGAL